MQPGRTTNTGGGTMEVVAAAPRCQLLLIVLMAAMLLPGMKGSPLLVRRKIARTIKLQEASAKGAPQREHHRGSPAGEKAIVQQWLEYRITRVDGHSSKEDTHSLLKDLNSYLEDKVYLAGYNFTLAGILLYYGLHRFIVDLTVEEKEKYLNVSRWFCHIQHYPDIRQHLCSVVFIKNKLYANSHEKTAAQQRHRGVMEDGLWTMVLM
ncbi:hypothetical protein STEG23_012590 [Scotinomys teguina]